MRSSYDYLNYLQIIRSFVHNPGVSVFRQFRQGRQRLVNRNLLLRIPWAQIYWMNEQIYLNLEPLPLSDGPFLGVLFKNSICAKFSSPTKDLDAQRIDLTVLCVSFAQAICYLKARGHSKVGPVFLTATSRWWTSLLNTGLATSWLRWWMAT